MDRIWSGLKVVIKGLFQWPPLFLGLFGGTGYTIARTLLNRKIRTAADVEQYLELPVLGVIPEAGDHKRPEEEGFWAGLRRKLWKK